MIYASHGPVLFLSFLLNFFHTICFDHCLFLFQLLPEPPPLLYPPNFMSLSLSRKKKPTHKYENQNKQKTNNTQKMPKQNKMKQKVHSKMKPHGVYFVLAKYSLAWGRLWSVVYIPLVYHSVGENGFLLRPWEATADSFLLRHGTPFPLPPLSAGTSYGCL